MLRRTSLTILLLVASCTSIATDDEIRRAEIGPEPNRAACEQYAREYLNSSLRDPMSAVIQFGTIGKSSYTANAFSSPRFAWSLLVSVNAKNAYGGYTGAQTYWFYFLGEKCCAVMVPGQRWNGYGYESMPILTEHDGGGWTAEQAGLR